MIAVLGSALIQALLFVLVLGACIAQQIAPSESYLAILLYCAQLELGLALLNYLAAVFTREGERAFGEHFRAHTISYVMAALRIVIYAALLSPHYYALALTVFYVYACGCGIQAHRQLLSPASRQSINKAAIDYVIKDAMEQQQQAQAARPANRHARRSAAADRKSAPSTPTLTSEQIEAARKQNPAELAKFVSRHREAGIKNQEKMQTPPAGRHPAPDAGNTV